MTPAQVKQISPVGVVVEDSTSVPFGWRRDRLQVLPAAYRRTGKGRVARLRCERREKVRDSRRSVREVRHVPREAGRRHPEGRVANAELPLDESPAGTAGDVTSR